MEFVKAHIVAPSPEVAANFAKEYYDEIGVRLTRSDIRRIDDRLEAGDRQGLKDMLETAPIGFASQCAPVGWIVHTVVQTRLELYRIETEEGDETNIVAPNPDAASAIWLSVTLDHEGTHPLWRITDGRVSLNDSQRVAIDERLETGPVGIVKWDDERGWLTLE